MTSMTEFQAWLDAFTTHWVNGDSPGLAALFSEDVHCYLTPFDPPLIGREDVTSYWLDTVWSRASSARFNAQAITFERNDLHALGYARWRASLLMHPNETHIDMDGVLLAQFNDEGECMAYRQWWHQHQSAAPHWTDEPI
ncbi:nuclear transport factor 2 family protein [Larsenimonas salina]|uniref:nuclear transport factor 2 family protein n=1 Tax=Larsenimonas salina TaxID=1295565 RepID=UPI002073B41B|nr:nuclear transport factor 2 family protein [Larsenimonas salina]MCM5704183.1 nuclear transport factor 2 family protein [Larsenimonas salina]